MADMRGESDTKHIGYEKYTLSLKHHVLLVSHLQHNDTLPVRSGQARVVLLLKIITGNNCKRETLCAKTEFAQVALQKSSYSTLVAAGWPVECVWVYEYCKWLGSRLERNRFQPSKLLASKPPLFYLLHTVQQRVQYELHSTMPCEKRESCVRQEEVLFVRFRSLLKDI